MFVWSDCYYSERLLRMLLPLNEQAKIKVDIDKIKKAICYAKKYHGDQKRLSGELYYSHPIEVAYMISRQLFRTDILVSSILHDTIEDTTLTKEMIATEFDEVIANQVQDLTRIKEDGRKISSAEMVEQLYTVKKYDVLIIKLFDRLHNIQTISAKSPNKAQKIVKETLQYFLVLSDLMELPHLTNDLYDICYKVNIKLGVVKDDHHIFAQDFHLGSVLISENKTNL